MQKVDWIKQLKFNTNTFDVQTSESKNREIQIFESEDILRDDMLVLNGGKSDWTATLTKKYNKLGLASYSWTKLEDINDAAVKSQDNLIDLIRMYEGNPKNNYKADMSNPEGNLYGFGLTKIAINYLKLKKPTTQTEAYNQLIKWLSVCKDETSNYIGSETFNKLPKSVQGALLDYHFKNGITLMRDESNLKESLANAVSSNSAEKWASVLKDLVWAKPAIKPFNKQQDNPGIYRRSLSRVILAAKGIKKGMSAKDAAIIDEAVKKVYEDAIKCSKANDNRGLSEIETIYQAYIGEAPAERTQKQTTSETISDSTKYIVPSKMGLFSVANNIMPEKTPNGVDSKALRIAVINEIIRLNSIPTDGTDNSGYPKVSLLEEGAKLTLPTSVKVGGKTIQLHAPADWKVVNAEMQSQQVLQTVQSPDSDNDEDMNRESVRVIDLLNKECPNPAFSSIGTDSSLQCATYRYKVQQGDTIYRLALRYGVDWKTMLADNNMTEKSILEIGTEIKINKIIYTVKNGDNLTQIAKRYGLTVDYMRDVNSIEDADKLEVGERLEFPGYIYTVKKGDNLIQISKKVGVDVAELGKLNGLKSPYTLQLGQKLLILFNDSSYNVSDSNKVTHVDDEGNTVTTIKSDNAMLAGRPYLHKEMFNGRCVANRHVFKPTKSGALNNKTIVVNAGHGYMPGGSMDNGAPGLKGCNDEVFVNYDNAMRLIKKLQDKGATVIYIQGYEGKSKKNLDLVSQELKKSKNKANLFISIHANSSEVPPAIDRAEIYYHRDSNSAHGKKLAGIFEKKLDNYQGKEKYAETMPCGYQVLRTAKSKGIPAILWEVAYINNKTGSQRLNNSSLMEKYTELLTDSVVEYFNNSAVSATQTATPEKQSSNSNYITHKVKKGDTIGSIAKKYGVTIEQIKKLNGLKNNNIQIGQKLKIKKK